MYNKTRVAWHRAGNPKFTQCAVEFAYGPDRPALRDGRVAAAQALSGTGSLRIGFEFIKRFSALGAATPVYVPNPTWGNHNSIIRVRCG